ncbi:MAG: SAM-dependent methyltransferase [Boseongicola sp.]
MSQRTSHFYRLVTVPAFYTAFQNILGAQRARKRLIEEHYQIAPDLRVLDVGCGPADLLELLPPCEYTGIDLNPEHIDAARNKYGNRGEFECRDVAELEAENRGVFDRILFSGLLHHLDDNVASKLLGVCTTLLAPGGILVGHEPVYVTHQNPIARWMKNRDSGQNIRNEEGYSALFLQLDGRLSITHYDDLIRIPYNHIVLSWQTN